MLTNSLKELAGDALKDWLNKFTGGTFSSILSGAVATMLIQSSTATTLLTIGFVGAGLLTFTQSIGIVIGANIGTTSIGWLISLVGFKISLSIVALPLIGIGVFINKVLVPPVFKAYGSFITGFGMLFFGISILQTGMADLQSMISFQNISVDSFLSKLILIGIGIIMTIIMQASGAAVAATLTALYAGAITFEQAAFLVIGQNIGTTATAIFASIGSSVAAKRTAVVHVLFNVVTAIIVTLTAPFILLFTIKISTFINNGVFDETLGIAIFHTLFSLIGMVIFLPFIQRFANFVMKIVPENENTLTSHLNTNLISIPPLAIDVSFKTLLEIVKELTDAFVILMENKKITVQYERKMQQVEEALDITLHFLESIESSSAKDRHKHIAILHALDHISRLVKVLQERQKVEAMYLQKYLIEKLFAVLTMIQDNVNEQDELINIASILEDTSTQMANERRIRRNKYFERTVSNETQLDTAILKVEAVLWIDRLVYHYWRAFARMAEYVQED